MKRTVIFTMLILLVSFWNAASGQEFHLKSGEIISGELISYEDGAYRLKSKYGILSILAEDVASALFNPEEGVVTLVTATPTTAKSPDLIRGTLQTIQNGTVRVKTKYGDVVVNTLDTVKYIASDQEALQDAEKPSTFSEGQEFHLKSGETISGELVSYAEGAYRVKSKYGVLSILAEDVSSVFFNTENGIVTIFTETAPNAENTDLVQGTVDFLQNGQMKIVTKYGYLVVNSLDKIARIQSELPSVSITVQQISPDLTTEDYLVRNVPYSGKIHFIDNMPVIEEAFGVKNVIGSHPVDGNTPTIFHIKVTGGTLNFQVHSHPNGNSRLQIRTKTEILLDQDIDRNEWQSFSIPIPSDVDTLELYHIATGWQFEYLYFKFEDLDFDFAADE